MYIKMSKTSADLPVLVAASHLANAFMQGYLEKKRPSKKLLSIKYQKRWCVVYGNFFIYYDSPDNKVQKGSFSLEGYRFLPCPGNGPYGFSLTSKNKRAFEFMAPNMEDYISWEKAIKKGISLTRRSTEPLRINKEKDKCEDTHRPTGPLEKSATMPNIVIPSNKNSNQSIAGSPCRRELVTHHSLSELTETATTIQTPIQRTMPVTKASTLPRSKPSDLSLSGNSDNSVADDEESEDDTKTDTESDDEPYVRPNKVNYPQSSKPVTYDKNYGEKSHTEDDYMTVLSSPICNPDNSKTDETDVGKKVLTEDDYMTVLSSPKSNSNKVDIDDPNSIYAAIHDDENSGSAKIPIYSSIKRQQPMSLSKTTEGIDKSDKAVYSSIKRRELIPMEKNADNTPYSRIGEDTDSDEDDYVNPNTIISYSQIISPNTDKLSESDYERVDDILPVRIRKESLSSSDSLISDYSSDYKDESSEENCVTLESDISDVLIKDRNDDKNIYTGTSIGSALSRDFLNDDSSFSSSQVDTRMSELSNTKFSDDAYSKITSLEEPIYVNMDV